jgi:hypothetical protein
MKRALLGWIVAGLAVGGLSPERGAAQEPKELLQHYRLIPRFSTLRQTGGIAGFDFRYGLLGEYDFDRGGVDSRMASFSRTLWWGAPRVSTVRFRRS